MFVYSGSLLLHLEHSTSPDSLLSVPIVLYITRSNLKDDGDQVPSLRNLEQMQSRRGGQ
jgi:hypothetical protein